jgi:heat shock protein HslJ
VTVLRVAALALAVGLAVAFAAGCGGDDGAGDTDALVTGAWEWEGTVYGNDTEAVPKDPSQYTVEFLEDGTLAVGADCNRAAGSWESDTSEGSTSGSLAITLGPTTLALCGPDSHSSRFLADLEGAGAYLLGDGKMRIDIQADVGTMTFGPAS